MFTYTSLSLAQNPKSSMTGLRRAVKEVAAHYVKNGVPFVVAGWQKRRRSAGDEASAVRRLHITFIAPKKVLADAPLFDPVAVARPRPSAAASASGAVLQHGYMEALEDM